MKVSQWIEQNLGMLLAAIATALSGYLVGQVTMQNRIDRMSDDMTAMKAWQVNVQRFNACLVRHIDRIENNVKGEPPCSLTAD